MSQSLFNYAIFDSIKNVKFVNVMIVSFGINSIMRIIGYKKALEFRASNDINAKYDDTEDDTSCNVTDSYIKLKQNVKECGGYFAIERFITFQNNMSKIINKKLVGFNIVFNGLLLMIYGFSLIFNSAINSKGVLINMFVGNIIAAALDITYLVDREFTLDYVTLSKDDLPVLAKTDALNYLTDAHKNTEFRIGSNDIIDRFIMNILFTKNRRYNRVKALFR